MDNISSFYNVENLKTRIREIRKLRKEQYKESLNGENKHLFEKYACCLSQESLANKIGIQRITLSAWETGNKIPTLQNIIELCQVCDCSIDYLLGSGDSPEIAPISTASYYSGIDTKIIKYGLENPDYLDCLNFFMLPENCSVLFNTLTLSAWKKYWIDSKLVDIKNPLKEDIIKIFNEYNAVTPLNEIEPNTYKAFLESKLPREKLVLTSTKTQNGFKIKGCIQPIVYHNFFKDKEFHYDSFINYLVDYTFEPLYHNALIEVQKVQLANAFVNLFTRYLEEM